MLKALLLDDKEKELFEPIIDRDANDNMDVWIGLIEDETDTACGLLGASSTPDVGEGRALTISFISIADGYDAAEGKRRLVQLLLDIAADLECSAVFCTGQFLDGTDDENEQLLEGMGFYAEEETMPLYTFLLSDIKVKDMKSDLGYETLSNLTDEQWTRFAVESEGGEFFVMDRDMYDKDLSIFLIDEEKEIFAGVLLSLSGDVLFVDALSAYGSDEEALINDLVLWGADGAKKRLNPKMKVDIFMPSKRVYKDMLMKITGNKAKKVGNLMTFTYDMPV